MIYVNTVQDVHKIAAFLRVNAKVAFEIAEELIPELRKMIEEFTRTHRVRVEIVDPSENRIFFYSGSGLLIGGGVGMALFGVPGLVVGTGVGALLGHELAHIRIRFEQKDLDGKVSFTIC